MARHSGRSAVPSVLDGLTVQTRPQSSSTARREPLDVQARAPRYYASTTLNLSAYVGAQRPFGGEVRSPP